MVLNQAALISGRASSDNDEREDRTRPIRVAVLGTGFGASAHIPALKALPEAEVVGVCARHQEHALSTAAKYQIPMATTDFRGLVRDGDVDAVIVAAPPHLHHQMTLAALDAGKHVLCEKPMARNTAESRDMVKMAAGAGLIAMVNHEFRYVPVRQRIRELIDEGYIGAPQAATLTVFRSSLADPQGRAFGWLMEQEKAGGMLGATGSHHIDALRWWFGEITAVAGATATMVTRRRLPDSSAMGRVDADDNYAFILRFANGAMATVHVTTTAAVDSAEEIVLSGSDGMLMAHGDTALYGARRGEGSLAELDVPERLKSNLGTFSHPLAQPTALLQRTWIRAIRSGKPAAPTFEDGAKVQEVLDGVARSSSQGRWIDTSGTRWPVSA
ncbi:MAG TPA: Gfo/Idh/MocA family oxidoreductase [Thermomicrobiales bacterium]|nr:Gfo/Idh/MocA family oxidoreductase [Thermomicrobiales bacterium]